MVQKHLTRLGYGLRKLSRFLRSKNSRQFSTRAASGVMCSKHEVYAQANKLTYPCLFAKTVDDAAENLTRIILNGDNGFDEGVDFWRGQVLGILDDECLPEFLNVLGTERDQDWWIKMFTQVWSNLSVE